MSQEYSRLLNFPPTALGHIQLAFLNIRHYKKIWNSLEQRERRLSVRFVLNYLISEPPVSSVG